MSSVFDAMAPGTPQTASISTSQRFRYLPPDLAALPAGRSTVGRISAEKAIGVVFLGDALVILAGLLIGFWLRFQSGCAWLPKTGPGGMLVHGVGGCDDCGGGWQSQAEGRTGLAVRPGA